MTIKQADREDQHWRVLCRTVRDSRIVLEAVHSLRFEMRHPLLLSHIEPVVELYFSSRPSDSDSAVGRLVEAHRSVVGEWYGFHHFFNRAYHSSISELLNSGFGKLAEGPQTLMERYAECLRRYGVAMSSPPPRPPVWWNGTTFVKNDEPLYALVLGSSYFVSPSVTATKC